MGGKFTATEVHKKVAEGHKGAKLIVDYDLLQQIDDLRAEAVVVATKQESIAVARGARYNPKIKLVAPLARYFMET